MKILKAGVTDPRRGGDFTNPFLTLAVDEPIRETGEPIIAGGNWRIIPHGPFVAIDCYDGPGSDEWDEGDLGVFNTTGLYRSRLVEAMIQSPEDDIDLAMPVDRARRLLRKHNVGWRYVLDDVAGQHGKVLWRLVEVGTPHCVSCGQAAVDEAYYRGTHLTFCQTHMSEHNRKVRHLRVNS